MLFYNKLLSLFKKKREEKDFFSPFLQEFKKILMQFKQSAINEFDSHNKLIYDEQTLQTEYQSLKKTINKKYYKMLLVFNIKLTKLVRHQKIVLQQKLNKETKKTSFFHQEINLQKIKNKAKISYLMKAFQREIQNIKKKYHQKEKKILSQISHKNKDIDDSLIHFEQQKKQLETKRKSEHQLLHQNFYTTDFNLNQKNKNIYQQLALELKTIEVKKNNNLANIEQIHAHKMELYQKNINKTHKIYQIKLNDHDQAFDAIKVKHEQKQTWIKTQKQIFFHKTRPISFLHSPFGGLYFHLPDLNAQKEKNNLYYQHQQNELWFLKEITLWKKKYNLININHKKAINYWRLEKQKQEEIYQKYQNIFNQIYSYHTQRINYLFAQKINDIQLQIKTFKTIYDKDNAIFDNQKDYQETFFSYHQTTLTLRRANNDFQMEYYRDFFHNQIAFELKNTSIILQLKLEKIKIHLNDLIKIIDLKKEISFLENQISYYETLQEDDFMGYQLYRSKDKHFFLKELDLQEAYIHYLAQKQLLKQHQLLTIIKQMQDKNYQKTTILKHLNQKILAFKASFGNKICLLEENVLFEFQQMLNYDIMSNIETQFTHFCFFQEKKYLFKKQQILDKLEILEQQIILCDKQLSFLSEKSQIKNINDNSKVLWQQVPAPLERIYHQINLKKEKYNKQSNSLSQKEIKITNHYHQKIKNYTQKYQQTIHQIQILQQKLEVLWKQLPFDNYLIQLHPLIVVKKISSSFFFQTWQCIFQKIMQVMFFLNSDQNNFWQKHQSFLNFGIKQTQIKPKKQFSNQTQIEHMLKLLDIWNEKIFYQQRKVLLQSFNRKKIYKQQELERTTHLMKQKIELLNENLSDALSNLKHVFDQKQMHLQTTLHLSQKEYLEKMQQQKLFLENKKIAIKRKNNDIFKNFIANKTKILKIFHQKEKDNQNQVAKINQKIKNRQNTLYRNIQTSLWKQKFKNLFLQWSLWRQKYRKTQEINSHYKKINKKIKREIVFEKSIS
ncbi:cytadherence high molecular weight protein 2 [Candidatus Phytoplasma solani]|uniref:cytadherence high molecular weight protein 2 n=1 Tax=Candidatus Phytoplasma solani TaxID=69896 RepID=UPI00358FF780